MSVPIVRPFAALRPAAERAASVAAPPYDVLGSDEARQRARGRPYSFLHVSKPEIDLPPGTDPHAPAVYAKAADNFRAMIAAGVLVRDPEPSYYAYRMEAGGQVQTGIVVGASIAAYEAGRIRRHELTRPDKEDDRVLQIEAVGAQTGPVMLVHRPNAALSAALVDATGAGACAVATVDGTRHSVWVIDAPASVQAISAGFEAARLLYIADGHHRSAAAARVAAARRRQGASADGPHQSFLAVSFAADQMHILDYNRVVRDLAGMTPAAFLARLDAAFAVTPEATPIRPDGPARFAMYLAGRWYRLSIKHPPAADAPPVARLDVSLLTDRLLAPVLGIGDLRTDPRIDFVGGARGLDGLARRVDSGEMAVAFALYPTSIEDLLAVADAGDIMPPKSTWFEPKLADGLVSLMLD